MLRLDRGHRVGVGLPGSPAETVEIRSDLGVEGQGAESCSVKGEGE